jgi:hypothetical protein
MRYKTIIHISLIATVLLFFFAVQADDKTGDMPTDQKPSAPDNRAGEQINWQVISSGGTDGSSASFGLQGTVGQTAVGGGTSDNYGLTHGFWQEFEGGGGTCCMGPIRGNVDYDVGDQIDISDLVFLVDYMFTGGSAPTCWEEANVDGSGDGPPDGSEDIDISDLVYLVDFMFNGGPAPLPCP